ncbi:hypothetical protein AJ88_28815 [Mesorhizobium amorphae CCBAU 01583]|nr:hypothetical protein AJ88_28815 [Mesorhizobium amorphae CCBAU 01583]
MHLIRHSLEFVSWKARHGGRGEPLKIGEIIKVLRPRILKVMAICFGAIRSRSDIAAWCRGAAGQPFQTSAAPNQQAQRRHGNVFSTSLCNFV